MLHHIQVHCEICFCRGFFWVNTNQCNIPIGNPIGMIPKLHEQSQELWNLLSCRLKKIPNVGRILQRRLHRFQWVLGFRVVLHRDQNRDSEDLKELEAVYHLMDLGMQLWPIWKRWQRYLYLLLVAKFWVPESDSQVGSCYSKLDTPYAIEVQKFLQIFLALHAPKFQWSIGAGLGSTTTTGSHGILSCWISTWNF